jgi:hypothetical protein
MISVQPLVKTSYTKKGNEYKESNLGKFAAGTSVAAATLVYGGEYSLKSAKKVYQKAKTVKIKTPKISAKQVKNGAKTAAKKVQQMSKDAIDTAKKVVNKETVKNFTGTMKSFGVKLFDTAKKGVEFIKINVKKINKENLKKASEVVLELAKKPAVKNAAGIAAGLALVLATGYLFDYAINKYNAHKADKKA